MIEIKKAETIKDFEGILALQRENSRYSISAEEKQIEGFVMVQHNLEDLLSFADSAPQLIATDQEAVCGYVLAMPKSLRGSMEMLVPMFEQLDQIWINGKSISAFDYLTIGQVCIKKGYRGIDLFDQMYLKYRHTFDQNYDLAITEISTSNIRSMRAHEKVGFKIIHSFKDQFEEWNIVLWDWNDKLSQKN